MINNEHRAHQKARERAISSRADTYLALVNGRFLLLNKPPQSGELLAGYHPSGNPMMFTELGEMA
jgi:hypothetical protein